MSWSDRVIYQLIRGVSMFMRLLSVRQACRLGRWLGGAAFRCMPDRRRIVINNLRIVYGGDKTYAECEAIGREVFRRAGANFIGGFRAGLLPFDRLPEVVEVRGRERAWAALEEKRGVLILIGHMGPWEVLAQVGKILFPDHPHGALYRPIDNAGVDAFVREEREKRETRLFSRKDGFAGPVGLLREGGALGIIADQRTASGGTSAPFFGRDSLTTRLPYILYRKSGAAIVSMSLMTVSEGKWMINVHPPVFPEREGLTSREDFVRRCNEVLEDALKLSVEDVFWFHRRWRPEHHPFFPASVEGDGSPVRRAIVILPKEVEAAKACASAVARYAAARKRAHFILAGENAEIAASGHACFAMAETVLNISPGASVSECFSALDAIDRQGPVGIDGAIVFSACDESRWAKSLRKLGINIILGPLSSGPESGVQPMFKLPADDKQSREYLAILESLTAR